MHASGLSVAEVMFQQEPFAIVFKPNVYVLGNDQFNQLQVVRLSSYKHWRSEMFVKYREQMITIQNVKNLAFV